MQVNLHILFVNGEVVTCQQKTLPSRTELQKIVDGDIEYVNVLFKGKKSTMIVNEIGAKNPPLPVNARATAIYCTHSLKTEPFVFDILNSPLIHGTVVLLDGIEKKDL